MIHVIIFPSLLVNPGNGWHPLSTHYEVPKKHIIDIPQLNRFPCTKPHAVIYGEMIDRAASALVAIMYQLIVAGT